MIDDAAYATHAYALSKSIEAYTMRNGPRFWHFKRAFSKPCHPEARCRAEGSQPMHTLDYGICSSLRYDPISISVFYRETANSATILVIKSTPLANDSSGSLSLSP